MDRLINTKQSNTVNRTVTRNSSIYRHTMNVYSVIASIKKKKKKIYREIRIGINVTAVCNQYC